MKLSTKLEVHPTLQPIIDSSNGCNQMSASVVCHCMDQYNSQLLGVLGTCFPPKLPFSLRRSSPPCNTLFLGPSPLTIPNGISISSAIFVWVQNAMLHNALSMGKKTPKTVLSPWDFITPPAEDRATAICNMHKKIGKDRACGSGSILVDRQTDMLITILCHRTHKRSNNYNLLANV